jgi:hypothetical protein
MPSISDALRRKLLQRSAEDRAYRPIAPDPHRNEPLSFNELVAASAFLDFGGIPTEFSMETRRSVLTRRAR